MSAEDFDRIRGAIDDGALCRSISDLGERLASLGLGTDALDTAMLIEALLGAATAQAWRLSKKGDIANQIASSDDLQDSDQPLDRNLLAERLSVLLAVDNVEVLAKGLDVSTEHPTNYMRSRIVTDIRPAYRGADVDKPAAAVITHTLRIDVLESNQRKSIYIGMDPQNLAELSDALQREAAKTEGLKSLLDGWELPLVRVGEEDLESGTSKGAKPA